MSDTSFSASGLSSVAAGAATSAIGGKAPEAALTGDKKKLHEVAQQFEAIFVRQMLAEARKTNMGDTLFSSQGTDTFREMQEQTFASMSTKSGGFGFAKMIEQRLGAQLAKTAAPAATTDKKG